jgi:23S rRNA-/tRNA-specific pseudouridylate synthase
LEVVPSRFFGQLTVVELRPQTGRRHQLRRHLHALGHPIVGDSRYSSRVSGGARAPSLPHNLLPGTTSPRGDAGGPSYCRRLCLWAVRIELPHPQRPDETLDCRHPEPIGWLERVLAFERETYSRGVIRPH